MVKNKKRDNNVPLIRFKFLDLITQKFHQFYFPQPK